MTIAQTGELTRRKPIRVWPGVAIVILQLLFRFVLPVVSPDQMFIGIMAGPLGAVAVVLWWLFFSRARWFERLGAVVLMVAALFATKQFVDVSLATGAMGYLFFFLAIPGLSVAFVVWAVATRDLPDGVRRVTMAATIILACGAWTLAKTGGFTASSFHNDLHWRWAKTAEERLLAETAHEPAALPVAPVAVPAAPVVPAKLATAPATIPSVTATAETGAGWPGFRGPHRDDIVQGVRIETDWSKTPPVQLWRRPIGPGWSSFAVNGNLIYTQEQRGPDEVVACYDATSGKPVWIHKDAVRFWESNGGPGPRGTPTLYNGRAYTFGATGMLNALDARTGAVVWKHNAAADT